MTDNRRAEVDQATENIDFDSTSYQIEFQTSLGRITLDLWPELAPGHCRNIIGLATISPPTTTGRSLMVCMPRMALCGGFSRGVDTSDPKTPPLVIEKVPP